MKVSSLQRGECLTKCTAMGKTESAVVLSPIAAVHLASSSPVSDHGSYRDLLLIRNLCLRCCQCWNQCLEGVQYYGVDGTVEGAKMQTSPK